MGIDYRVLTKNTFDFLLQIKQQVHGKESSQLATDDNKLEESRSKYNDTIKTLFAKVVVQKKLSTSVSVDLIEFDNFFDQVFMKFKIMSPNTQSQEQIKLLLGVQFGINQKQTFLLVSKIERVLFDLGFIYVNIAKMLRHEEADQNQKQALADLKQRYDFVARGISKQENADKDSKENKRITESFKDVKVDYSTGKQSSKQNNFMQPD